MPRPRMKHVLVSLGAVAATGLVAGGIVVFTADDDTAPALAAPACVRPTTDVVPDQTILDYIDCLTGVTPSPTPSPSPSPTPTPTPTPTPSPTPTPTEPPAALKLIGMSAPADQWTQRLSEVGACGVESRRIFAQLTSNGQNQSALIQQAVSQGMMPVISYKVPNPTTMASGGYDTWVTAARNYLAGLGVQVTATYWHEPHGDMTPAQFTAGSQRFFDRMQAPNIAVGPILNGWLLDRRVSDFASYTTPALLNEWDFLGLDTYQEGTAADPGPNPGRAVPLAETWLDSQGHPDLLIGVGEYNGYTADAIEYAGETLLSTPEVWFGSVWNQAGAEFTPLTGTRLAAYKATKADARAKNDC